MAIVKFGNTRIYFERRGRGPHVVFLPGLSLDGGFFRPVADALQSEFTSVLVDIRGAGSSDAPRDQYSIEIFAGDIEQLVKVLQIEEAMLVGHSMGGFVGLELALTARPWLTRLMLISTSRVGLREALQPTPRAARALRLRQGAYREIIREIAEVGMGRRVRQFEPGVVADFVEQRLAHPPRGAGFAGQSAAAAKFDRRGALHSVELPCTVIHGADDEIIPSPRGLELAREINGAKFVLLDDVGHFAPWEDPEAVAREIRLLARRTTAASAHIQ